MRWSLYLGIGARKNIIEWLIVPKVEIKNGGTDQII
jgi:hypothetical protein